MQQIGFIGLGNMGVPMVRNLLQSGFPVTVYNRTASKAEPLIREGAKYVSRPVDVLSADCIVLTMVANDHALEEIVFGENGIGKGLKKGHIHVSMSTISPQTSERLTTFHQEKGADYLVANVLGRPEAAAAKKLWVLLAGPNQAKQKVQNILKTLGQGVFDIGEEPKLANLVKLCSNFLLLAAVEGLAETFAFAQKNGISPELLAKIFGESIFACSVYQIYGKIVSTANFEPGMHLELGMKDMTLLRTSAENSRVPMPFLNLLHERLLTAQAKGRDHLDWSAIALSSLEDAGIESASCVQ